MYYYGFGFQIGHPSAHKTIPYAQFTYSKFTMSQKNGAGYVADSTLSIGQISGGFIIPIKRINKVYLTAKVGYTYAIVKESFLKINEGARGFIVGFGAETKLVGKSRVYINFSYNFQKTSKSALSDFDLTRLSLGFVI